MTFEKIHAWCRANETEVRGIYYGKQIFIGRNEEGLPGILPSLSEIFHWELQVGDMRYPTSPSDMEKLVTGRMTLDTFIAELVARRSRVF